MHPPPSPPPSHIGHLQGKRQQFFISKTLILINSSQFIKFYIQWSKIDQFRDDLTVFGALNFETNNTTFKTFVDFNQNWAISTCWNFRRLTENILDFFFTHWHQVGNKSCTRWDQKVHQKLQNILKKSGTLFCAKNLSEK